MDSSSRYAPTSPIGGSVPRVVLLVQRLDSDVLCLIFAHLRDSDDARKRWCGSNVRTTHVCRFWRNVALCYAPLWDELRWSPNDSVEAALAVLHRSRRAPLDVYVNVVSCIHKPTPTPEQKAAVHWVVRAVLRHASRIAVLDFLWSDEYYAEKPFAPLFSTTKPLQMPYLRSLSVHSSQRSEDSPKPPRLTFAADDLRCITFDEIRPASLFSLVGNRTVHLTLNRFIMYRTDDLVDVLKAVPNLETLRISRMHLVHMVPYDLPSHGTVSTKLRVLDVEEVFDDFLHFISLLLPLDKITDVTLSVRYLADAEPSAKWTDFLSLPSLGKVAQMLLLHTPGEWSHTSIRLTGARGRTRTLVAKGPALAVLFESPKNVAIFSTLKQLTIDASQWAPFLEIAERVGVARLLALRALRLRLGQASDVPRKYAGREIALPRLNECVVDVLAAAPATKFLLHVVTMVYKTSECDSPSYEGCEDGIDAIQDALDHVAENAKSDYKLEVAEWAMPGYCL